MSNPAPGSEDWLALVRERIIDPERPIIDSHHHLWEFPDSTYKLDEFWSDTNSGHNIHKTVFLECGTNYAKEGPKYLRPVGETAFVEAIASESAGEGAEIAAIVAKADLTSPYLDDVLDAHEEAGKGLLRGIRHAGAWDAQPEDFCIAGPASKGLFASDLFRAGLVRLGQRGYSFDSWHFHHQNLEFRDLALSAPDTTMVLDHFGTPIGIGRYADQREQVFAQWREDVAKIAECPNVVAKLGGMAMPDNGYGWNNRDTPPSSDEFVEAQSRYYHHTIQCFGAERCMFESNFPVDRLSLSYHVLWNGFKKIAADYSADEQTAMFLGTAKRVYKLA